MAIEVRAPTLDEWPALCAVDARGFGVSYTADDIADRLKLHDVGRFRCAFDDDRIVALAASYKMDVALPGGAVVPMGGVTWVSTSVTHRRQGLMSRVVRAVHDDIAARGEPIATLYAAEGGIYEHLDYGIATKTWFTTIDPRRASVRAEFCVHPNPVRFLEGEEIVPTISAFWDRFRAQRAGEIGRDLETQQYLFDDRAKPQGEQSGAYYLAHDDGYAAYRAHEHWNDGQPSGDVYLIELVALTPEAHAALWQTLLSMDLVGEIRARCMPIDDPLPYLIDDPRALRTRALNDGTWVNVLDIPTAFSARTYRTTDCVVVEVDGTRWAVEGAPDGGSCREVDATPDLVTTHGAFSALLYGGVYPSALVAGRRMTARHADALARADLFFTTSLAPHTQEIY
ncbi:MAG TPA: GNAT family N-acetyltransferase [Acidimicrobiia bacterium]|nr:GNAT family N-acetyltransferase [Acidimicrobiia bacterium]